jgi:hypothetical protein
MKLKANQSKTTAEQVAKDTMPSNQPEDLSISWFTRNTPLVDLREQQILIASIRA